MNPLVRFSFVWLSLLMGTVVSAQQPLPDAMRTNGEITLRSVSMVRTLATSSVVRVLNDDGHTVQLGVVAAEDGYVLTKASEVPAGKKVRLGWSDGTQGLANVVASDSKLDLLLLRQDKKDATPLSWHEAEKFDQGEWVTSFTHLEAMPPQLRLGCLSAKRRPIPGHGAAMGISMEDERDGAGVRITGIASESPAESAGLQIDDILLAMDGEPVVSMRKIQQFISICQPGKEVQLLVRRGPAERHCSLRLASRSKIVSNWEGEDYANGGVSLRTDDFPDVLQHQIPLNPADMGGPLLNLDGKPIALNIARVDRVTTFALPMKAFWSKVQEWMVKDRRER